MKFPDKLFFIAACAVAVSCVNLDYGETRPGGAAPDSIEGIRNAVSDIYAQVYDNEFAPGSASFLAGATDEAVYALQGAEVNNYVNGGWSPASPLSSHTWARSYSAIASICNCLESIDKADTTGWKRDPDYDKWSRQLELFPYELRFLRAYFYFELFRAYGEVPLVTTALTREQADTLHRAPVDRVVEFIVDEVDAIAPYLPVSYATELGGEAGRATRCAAYALKARTLLYAASPLFNPTGENSKWGAAAEASKFIIDHAEAWGLKLSRYDLLWGNDAFSNKELIFGIECDASNAFEMANYPVGIENGASGNCPSQSLVDSYEYCDNGETFRERNAGTVELWNNPYEGLDPRFQLTIVKNGDEWPTNGLQKKTIETFAGGFNGAPKTGATPTGYYLRKFVDGGCVTSFASQTSSRHTWMVFRLAEFYLDFAEAAFHAAGSANDGTFGMSANDAVNVLRTRSDINMPKFKEDGDAWVERYERERLVELAFENHRFWDVRRWKKAGQYFKTVNVATITGDGTLTRSTEDRVWDDKFYLFPIPHSELNKNPNLSQNPGWDMKDNENQRCE